MTQHVNRKKGMSKGMVKKSEREGESEHVPFVSQFLYFPSRHHYFVRLPDGAIGSCRYDQYSTLIKWTYIIIAASLIKTNMADIRSGERVINIIIAREDIRP